MTMTDDETEIRECSCGHLVKISKKYKWNDCSKCGKKIEVDHDR